MKKLHIAYLLASLIATLCVADSWIENGASPSGLTVDNRITLTMTNDPANVTVTNALSLSVTNEPVNIVITNEISIVVTNSGGGGGAGDNLGNHIATDTLQMASHDIIDASSLSIGTESAKIAFGSFYPHPDVGYVATFQSVYNDATVGFKPWGAGDGAVLAYNATYNSWLPKMIMPFEQITLVSGATFKQDNNLTILNAAPATNLGIPGIEIRGGTDAGGDGGWIRLKPGVAIPAADAGFVELANEAGQGIIRVESTGQVKSFNQSSLSFDTAVSQDFDILIPSIDPPGYETKTMHFVNGLFVGLSTPNP